MRTTPAEKAPGTPSAGGPQSVQARKFAPPAGFGFLGFGDDSDDDDAYDVYEEARSETLAEIREHAFGPETEEGRFRLSWEAEGHSPYLALSDRHGGGGPTRYWLNDFDDVDDLRASIKGHIQMEDGVHPADGIQVGTVVGLSSAGAPTVTVTTPDGESKKIAFPHGDARSHTVSETIARYLRVPADSVSASVSGIFNVGRGGEETQYRVEPYIGRNGVSQRMVIAPNGDAKLVPMNYGAADVNRAAVAALLSVPEEALLAKTFNGHTVFRKAPDWATKRSI